MGAQGFLRRFGWAIVLLGCSASAATTHHGSSSNGEGSSGGTGSGSADGGPSGTDGFGNSSGGDTTGSSSGTIDAGNTDCDAGHFCPSKNPDGDCGSLTVKGDAKVIKKPGNVLVIFDRSGSMDQDWNGTPKYQSAGNALIAALQPLQDLLTVGGIFFPSVDQQAAGNMCDCSMWQNWALGCCLTGAANSCVTSTIDKPDQISFRPAADFITELPNQWRLQGANGTPLEQGVTRGQEALAGQTFTDPVTVVILTDGAPNCNTNQQNVIDQIQAWHDKGIITHVVGLPGAGGAAQLLDQLAMTGGSASYIDPADPTVLQNELAKVFTSTIKVGLDSCTIHLDQKPEAPEKLHLVVKQNGMEQDVPRMLSKTAGWNLNSAADTVTLTGQLCDLAKSGTFEELRFEYGCVDLPPLPPPPVPQ